jgi:hypothetical protein
MLIDDYLPEFDVVERHGLVIRATPARVWDALRAADFGRSPLLATLLALRALPSLLTAPRRTLRRLRERRAGRLTLDTLFSRGFVLLEERPHREMLIGLEGRFWTATADLRPTDARRFREALASGLARVAWDFRAEPLPDGRVRLTTETRVRCADAATRRRFRAYWLLVRPGSGLIRGTMLRAIRRAAESPAHR